MSWLSYSILTVCFAVGVYLVISSGETPRPHIEESGWFGRGEKEADDTSIRDFKVSVPEPVLTDLKLRLNNIRYGEDLENNENFYYGMNVATMKKIVVHWKEKYDWRKYEAELNQFPQFVTQIEGIDVHFVRVRPARLGKGIFKWIY